MDPRFRGAQGIKKDAVIAYLLGVLATYLIQIEPVGLGGGGIFRTLIIVAVGGGWYHWRNVL